LTASSLRADYPAWTVDSREIVFAAQGSLWRMAAIPGSAPTRIPYIGEDGVMAAISRPQGHQKSRLMYVRRFLDTNFWRIQTTAPGTPATGAPERMVSSTTAESHCQFSPDGRRIAFVSLRSGTPEVWISDPDGSHGVQLTSLGARDTTWPFWSPNGQEIAFSSTHSGEFDIYKVPAAGGPVRRLTSHPAIDIQPTYSRDGRWIYFSSMRSGDFRIWRMPAGGGEAVQVTPNQGRAAQESRDGESIYYHSVSVVAPLWRLPLKGGAPFKVLDGVTWYNLAIVDRGAYYMERVDAEVKLQYLDFSTSKVTTVARNVGEVSPGLTVSPDGRTIVYTRIDASGADLMLVENFR
jgi:Tol biopolymer transport system component